MEKSETSEQGEANPSQRTSSNRALEHFSAVLPFSVVEKIVDKPLRIRGVAMAVGMSRNFNVYTPEELQEFSSKLVGAPIYIEHVSVNNAVGKVTKTDWDGHALWYEAEIYESEVADKIRKGLVQHVSVGADYEAIDVVDGKVPHGLHNAELSLVAVPGIPETNVQVLEKLAVADASVNQGTPKGTEVMHAKSLEELVTEAVQKSNTELKETREKLIETEGKLGTAEKALTEAIEKLTDTEGKLTEAQSTIEQLKNSPPSDGLVKDPPRTMPVAEAIIVLERLLPSPAVERSTLGMQRECQEIRSAILKLKERLQSA
jgi:flagellin-like hook-associated protein FlgL